MLHLKLVLKHVAVQQKFQEKSLMSWPYSYENLLKRMKILKTKSKSFLHKDLIWFVTYWLLKTFKKFPELKVFSPRSRFLSLQKPLLESLSSQHFQFHSRRLSLEHFLVFWSWLLLEWINLIGLHFPMVFSHFYWLAWIF